MRRMTGFVCLVFFLIGGISSVWGQTTLSQDEISTLQKLLTCLTTQGSGEVKDVVFQGCNVYIQNGMGDTRTKNGTGNLIVGYNDIEVTKPDRSGSHNLVIGDWHSYSSWGGLVAGRGNTVSGIYASVSGGFENTASGAYASVSGGRQNTANGENASVTGGYGNMASELYASVTGGQQNTASGAYASVTGGQQNTASDENSVNTDNEVHIAALQEKLACLTTQGSGEVKDIVFGGCNVYIQNGMGSTDTKNGTGNLIIGYNEEYSPGERDGSHNLVIGPDHTYSSYGGFVAGIQNTISGAYASILGGGGNTASGDLASVSGGSDNAASGGFASVSGGASNTASGIYAAYSVVVTTRPAA